MIALDAEPLHPAQAARRAARGGADPFWLTSPGRDSDVAIAFDAVGADPVRVVRGGDLDELEEVWRAERRLWSAAAEPPPSLPIGVGWLCYDLGRRWIPLPARAADDHGWPDLEVRFHDAVWMRDAARGTARILARDQRAARRLAERLAAPAVVPPPTATAAIGAFTSDQPAADYFGAVQRILAYLVAGDAYQVNLARRLSAAITPGDPLWIAEALRARAPAPHAIWLGCNGGRDYLVGNSPERFLHADGRGGVETRPIKGTRPRGAAGVDQAADDIRLRRELITAPKERAEHVMIVDLERNDLGRVCATGSIAVEGLARVMELPTVFHLVTTVRGRLRPEVGLAELLRATFPGGSITGAPKRRAMEIIEELEPVRRGPYTGATGWLGAAGDLDLAVAIRTALVRGRRLTLSVGGGIVADSNAQAELAETEAKARAFRDLC
ncbi:MAG TPA: anthranilate synthase component I family protein [Polyangia bacterium]|nr:anthranilate synthase component I family protein [Polyangia bacterium]